MNTGLVLVASGGAVLYSVISILHIYLRSRFLRHAKASLKKPDEAELFIKDFLSRHPSDNVGANE